jgi:nucleotide-binding universal stress UspA family protein
VGLPTPARRATASIVDRRSPLSTGSPASHRGSLPRVLRGAVGQTFAARHTHPPHRDRPQLGRRIVTPVTFEQEVEVREQRVVVGVDSTEESRCAVEWCAVNAGPHSEVIAVASMSKLGEFVLGLPSFDDDPAAHVLGRAQTNWVAPLHDARVPVRVRFEEDASWRAILTVAADEHADLIVAGKQHRHLLTKFLSPADADLLAHHASCPVLIVPVPVLTPSSR